MPTTDLAPLRPEPTRSYSATINNQRAVAAWMWAASSVIAISRRSVGTVGPPLAAETIRRPGCD